MGVSASTEGEQACGDVGQFAQHFFHLMWGVGLFFNPTNPFAKLRAPVSRTVRSLQKRNPKQKLPRSGFWLG